MTVAVRAEYPENKKGRIYRARTGDEERFLAALGMTAGISECRNSAVEVVDLDVARGVCYKFLD